MTIRDMLQKIRQRRPERARREQLVGDWTTGWTPRDWADLPVHHPRRDSGV